MVIAMERDGGWKERSHTSMLLACADFNDGSLERRGLGCRKDLKHPSTAVDGIFLGARGLGCRKDLKHPSTAVDGIFLGARGLGCRKDLNASINCR